MELLNDFLDEIQELSPRHLMALSVLIGGIIGLIILLIKFVGGYFSHI